MSLACLHGDLPAYFMQSTVNIMHDRPAACTETARIRLDVSQLDLENLCSQLQSVNTLVINISMLLCTAHSHSPLGRNELPESNLKSFL